MLDRENKREKILEGKLREIKIKLKKQQEAADLLARQAEKAVEDVKDDVPLVKPSLSQSMSNFLRLSTECEFCFSLLIHSYD